MRRGQLCGFGSQRLQLARIFECKRLGKFDAQRLRFLEPARHLALSLGQRERAQVAAFHRKHIVKDDMARIIRHELRVGRFAIEPLLQMVEAGDLITGFDDQLTVEHRMEIHPRQHIGERAGNIVAAAGKHRLAAGRRYNLHADAVEFPLRQEGIRRDARQVRILKRMGEHDGVEGHGILRVRLRPALFQPGEKVEIRGLLRMPNLLDLTDAHAAEIREHVLHRAGRHAYAKRARAKLQERPPLRRGHIIEEKREILADSRLVARLELVDDLMQWRKPVQDQAVRVAPPDMRDRLRHFAHIIVGQRQQDRINTLGHEIAHEGALEQLEIDGARDDAHRETSIRIGRAAQVIREDRGFIEIGMGVIKPVEKRGEGLHVRNVGNSSAQKKRKPPGPFRPQSEPTSK